MAAVEVITAPLHDAAARSRSREQGAHVRAHGSASSRRRASDEHRGEFQRHDAAEAGMPGAMALATFAEAKVARSRQRAELLLVRRAEMDMDVLLSLWRLSARKARAALVLETHAPRSQPPHGPSP